MDWTPEDALAVVRSRSGVSRPGELLTVTGAEIDGQQLLVSFRVEASAPGRLPHDPETRFRASYSLADLRVGPLTGSEVATPEQWVREIEWGLDEQVGTGGLARAERTRTPDGVVLLRWRW